MAQRRRRHAPRDEHGAVAILVSVFALVMFVLAALIVDLGFARDQRLQAQSSADAAALAAGNELYRTGTANLAAAVDAATSYGTANYGITSAEWGSCTDPGKPPTWVTVSGRTACVSFDKSPNPEEVRVVMPGRDVKTTLGALAGVSKVPVGAMAQAKLKATSVTGEGGLRPWGICSKVVNTAGTVTFVPMKGGSVANGDSSTGCGSNGPPGGWWVAQCTGQSNSNGATEASVLNGCPTSSYMPVPGQPVNGTPTQLYDTLTDYCPKKSENATCLASDPGNNFHNAANEWQTLVGHTITMPVFCFPPQCSSEAFTAQGQNASYGIYRMATVEVCGFNFGTPSTGWPTTGNCDSANPKNYTSSSGSNGLFLVVKKLEGGATADWQLALPPSGLALSR